MRKTSFVKAMRCYIISLCLVALLTSMPAVAQDAPPAPTKTVTISPYPEITQGLLIKKVEPKYASIAKAAGLQGDVVLKATIGKDGRRANLYVVSGPDLLKDAALKKWVY
jgi:outer membrane biosynthesis protein TonB